MADPQDDPIVTYPLVVLDEPKARLWSLRVRIPLIPPRHQMEWVWVLVSEFGVNEDEVMENALRRFPEATQVLPVSYTDELVLSALVIPPPPKVVVCQSIHQEDTDKVWCRFCGEPAVKHPILAGTPEGANAANWIASCRSEMQGWEYGGFGLMD